MGPAQSTFVCPIDTGATRGHAATQIIMSWISWRNWPATQAILCASTTRCRRRRPQATSRVMTSLCTLVLIALTILLSMFQSAAITLVIALSTTDTKFNRRIHTNDYLQARAGDKNRKNKDDYAAVGTAFAPAIVSVAGQIHPEFLLLLWVFKVG